MKTIHVDFNKSNGTVLLRKNQFSRNDIKILVDNHHMMESGQLLQTHYVPYMIFKHKLTEYDFIEPQELIDRMKYFMKCNDLSKKLKSLDSEMIKKPELIHQNKQFDKLLSRVKLADGFELKPHQKTGCIYNYYFGGVLIGDDLGLGKTLTAFATYQIFKHENPNGKMIYVTKVDLVDNVYYDIERMIPDLKLCKWSNKSGKKIMQEVEGMEWDVLIINLDKFRARYETLHKIFQKLVHKNELIGIVVDECTTLKNNWDGSMSQMTTNFMYLVDKFYKNLKFRIGLSGTPIENSISDLFNLYYFVDRDFLGGNFEWFAQNFYVLKYMRVKQYGNWVAKATGIEKSKNTNLLKQIIKPKFIQRYHSDVPEFKTVEIPIYLTDKEKKEYNAIIDRINDKKDDMTKQDAFHILTPMLNYFPSKMNMLKEVLEKRKVKDVVFCKHIENCQEGLVDFMIKHYPNEFMYVNGINKNNWKRTTDIADEFKAKRNFLLASDCLQHGHNFQFANRVIHYELPWKWSTFQQRNGRVRRIGQDNEIYWIVFYVKYSIEEDIWNKIKSKGKLLKAMTENLDENDEKDFSISGLNYRKIL